MPANCGDVPMIKIVLASRLEIIIYTFRDYNDLVQINSLGAERDCVEGGRGHGDLVFGKRVSIDFFR
jgi:hypothetical protein